MNSLYRLTLNKISSFNWIFYIEIAIIVVPSIFPLFFNLPYRVNIFLSWEGAYRLYIGQIPYVDFGLPMGFGFWVIPALFFKLFGPYLFSLVKAQVFINILSLIAFRNILKLLGVDDGKRALAILVFVLSYSFSNFWPWYNHSVYVFHLIGLNFILLVLFSKRPKKVFYVLLAAFFSFFAFFTKQDSGALTIIFCGILLLYYGIAHKNYKFLFQYIGSLILFAAIFIIPFIDDGFLYWFNYGQPPHNARINLFDFINSTLGGSEWEKFYILLIVLVIWKDFNLKKFFVEEKYYVFLLITLGTILQALIIQITSPLPTDHYIYFHAFAFAFIIYCFNSKIDFKKVNTFFIFSFLLLFWWSALYWDYANRILKLSPPSPPSQSEVNYSKIQSKWIPTDLKAFENVTMPKNTIEGIHRLLNLDIVKNKENLKVLNMSELTPLAYEMGFEPLKNQPLWYHLNVGMFKKQVNFFNEKIQNEYYDLVLFQSIPGLDNFFPYAVQDKLKIYYDKIDTFEAPRKRSEGYSFIEVYVRKK